MRFFSAILVSLLPLVPLAAGADCWSDTGAPDCVKTCNGGTEAPGLFESCSEGQIGPATFDSCSELAGKEKHLNCCYNDKESDDGVGNTRSVGWHVAYMDMGDWWSLDHCLPGVCNYEDDGDADCGSF